MNPNENRIILQKDWDAFVELIVDMYSSSDFENTAQFRILLLLKYILYLMWKGIITPFEASFVIDSFVVNSKNEIKTIPELDIYLKEFTDSIEIEKKPVSVNFFNLFLLKTGKYLDNSNIEIKESNQDYSNYIHVLIEMHQGIYHSFNDQNIVEIFSRIYERFQTDRNLSEKPDFFKTGVDKFLENLSSGKIQLTPFTANQAYGILSGVAKSSQFSKTLAPFIAEWSVNVLTAGSSLTVSSFMELFVSKAPWIKGVFAKTTETVFEKFVSVFAKTLVEEMSSNEKISWSEVFEKSGHDAVASGIQKFVASIFFHNMKIDINSLREELNFDSSWQQILVVHVGESTINKLQDMMEKTLGEMASELK